ncbi:hypothetical protein HN662_01490 [Candidatus Woesearchaeota archaeon]|jgi:hypothetical protein|nr:hypothetical protein [Candidatus Woesearchaeota archaeon]
MKKKCIVCKKEKNINEFYYRKKDKTYRGDCKECLLFFQKERWKARKVKAVELFGGECSICGYSSHLAALEFHHYTAEKKYNWNRLQRKPWNEIIEELKKCILVCRNCHAELHHPNYKKENIDLSFADRHLNEDRFEPHRYKIKSSGKCPVCDSEVYGTKYCSTNCAQMAMRKVVRPTKKELKKDIKEMSWSAIGRKYGVSDNAVRKWARKYDIPTKTPY